MTDEEVQQIYDYLHENYEYRDGELIRLVTTRGANIGDKYGTITLEREKRIVINCSVGSGDEQRMINLAHMIYIFHYKKKPKYVDYIDGNYANTRIENLREISKTEQLLIKINGRGYVPRKDKDGKTRFHCQLNVEEKTLSLGVFNNSKDAHDLYLKAKEMFLNGISIEHIRETLTSYASDKNKTGIKGVKSARGKFYRAFQINKVMHYTRCFNTPEEAHAAYLKAKEEHKNG